MRNTGVVTAPTGSQLDLCRRLGITVPGEASRADVSKLIDRRKQELHAQLTKKAGIRPGNVVRKQGRDVGLLVVVSAHLDEVRFRFVADGKHGSFVPYIYPEHQGPTIFVDLVFAAPEGWMHAYAVQPPQGIEEARDDYRKRRARMSAYIARHLKPDEQQTLEYGEYWRNDAIERLRVEFAATDLK